MPSSYNEALRFVGRNRDSRRWNGMVVFRQPDCMEVRWAHANTNDSYDTIVRFYPCGRISLYAGDCCGATPDWAAAVETVLPVWASVQRDYESDNPRPPMVVATDTDEQEFYNGITINPETHMIEDRVIARLDTPQDVVGEPERLNRRPARHRPRP